VAVNRSGNARMEFVRGDATGLRIPAHGEALRAGGEAFLTAAFQTFGVLAPDNRIARITRLDKCPGGSTGEKFFLSVEYERPHPDLHADLFVKFSRDFADPIRDSRGKYEMESEIRFAAISRLPDFPIKVPAAYFADYHHESSTGVLITERIDFGSGIIEPHRLKCRDHELPDPLPHYQAILKALARIAAAHRSGRLSPDIAARFPYDSGAAAANNAVPFDEPRLRELVADYASFATQCPQLLPANISSPQFITRFAREAVRFLEHEVQIRRFLQSNPDFIALCHWNANIDNAWFWRAPSGALECGLMDWGRVGQMNVAFPLWGCLSGAGLPIWDRHIDDLLALFTRELHEHGGPRLEIAELMLHLQLYVALMGLSYFMESPARIRYRLPGYASASGPLDPLFQQNETARNQLHILTVVLNFWQTRDFGASLDGFLLRGVS